MGLRVAAGVALISAVAAIFALPAASRRPPRRPGHRRHQAGTKALLPAA